MVKLTSKFMLGVSGQALAAALAIAPTLNNSVTAAAPVGTMTQIQSPKAAATPDVVHHYPATIVHHYP